MPLSFARAQCAVWGAFFAATLAAALLWWPLPLAAADRGLLAATGLALSSIWRLALRRTRPAGARALVGVAASGIAVGGLWHALHQTGVAALFDASSVVGLWRHGVPKLLATAAMPVGAMLAWGAAYTAVRALREASERSAPGPLASKGSEGAAGSEAADGPPPVYPDRLVVRETARVVPVPVASVRWVEAVGDYVRLHTDAGRSVLHRQTMQAMEQTLDPGAFVRIHRSAIVRTDAVREVRRLGRGDAEAVLDDGTVHRIGRAYRSALDARLGR